MTLSGNVFHSLRHPSRWRQRFVALGCRVVAEVSRPVASPVVEPPENAATKQDHREELIDAFPCLTELEREGFTVVAKTDNSSATELMPCAGPRGIGYFSDDVRHESLG